MDPRTGEIVNEDVLAQRFGANIKSEMDELKEALKKASEAGWRNVSVGAEIPAIGAVFQVVKVNKKKKLLILKWLREDVKD